MYDEKVSRCSFSFIYIYVQYKNQKIGDSVLSEDPFMLVYCPNKYQTQRMWDEAVVDCLYFMYLCLYIYVYCLKFISV